MDKRCFYAILGACLVAAPVGAKAPGGTTYPKPLGNPGDWVTSDDYPTNANNEGREGLTGVAVHVDSKGHVFGCNTTLSSGSKDLDAAACSLISSRTVFSPSHDRQMRPVPGVYRTKIRWILPKSPLPQPLHVVTSNIVEIDGSMSDCKIDKVEGDAATKAKVGPVPCPTRINYTSGYADDKGNPVRRRVVTSATVELQDVPDVVK